MSTLQTVGVIAAVGAVGYLLLQRRRTAPTSQFSESARAGFGAVDRDTGNYKFPPSDRKTRAKNASLDAASSFIAAWRTP